MVNSLSSPRIRTYQRIVAVVGPVDRQDVVVLATQRVEPPVDLTLEFGQSFGVEDLDHVHDTRSRTVRSL